MAEPLKKTPAPERDPLTRDPRTPSARGPERTRSERDLGKGKDSGPRPADKQRKASRSQGSSDRSSHPKRENDFSLRRRQPHAAATARSQSGREQFAQ